VSTTVRAFASATRFSMFFNKGLSGLSMSVGANRSVWQPIVAVPVETKPKAFPC
jgi:hypothetical protein